METTVMESGVFRLKRWKCYLLMLVHDARPAAWLYLAVAVALAVWGFIFSPWMGIAALGLDAFLLAMVMNLVIIAYGFRTVTGVNLTPHTLRLHGDELEVVPEEGKSTTIGRREFRPYHIYPGGVILPFEGKLRGWLWLPTAAFDSTADLQDFIKAIYRKNESNTE